MMERKKDDYILAYIYGGARKDYIDEMVAEYMKEHPM